MIGRRAVIGLSLLSMLVFCAVAAPSAFATKGTTGFTCVKTTVKPEFLDAHCKEKGVPVDGYKHEEIKPGTETAITVSNKNTFENTTKHTPAILHGILAGLKATVTCTNVHGTGTQTNNAGPPMNVSGTITTSFSECTAELGGKACESVNGGAAIVTKALTSTPTEAMEVKFEEDKEAFATFKIKCAGKEFEIKVTGSATAITESGGASLGTTLQFTEASTIGDSKCTGNGLCFGGQPSFFTATVTPTMSTTEPGIGLTTTES